MKTTATNTTKERAYHNESFKKHFLDQIEEYNLSVFDNGKKNKAYNKDIFSLISKIDADLIYLIHHILEHLTDTLTSTGYLMNILTQKSKVLFQIRSQIKVKL